MQTLTNFGWRSQIEPPKNRTHFWMARQHQVKKWNVTYLSLRQFSRLPLSLSCSPFWCFTFSLLFIFHTFTICNFLAFALLVAGRFVASLFFLLLSVSVVLPFLSLCNFLAVALLVAGEAGVVIKRSYKSMTQSELELKHVVSPFIGNQSTSQVMNRERGYPHTPSVWPFMKNVVSQWSHRHDWKHIMIF